MQIGLNGLYVILPNGVSNMPKPDMVDGANEMETTKPALSHAELLAAFDVMTAKNKQLEAELVAKNTRNNTISYKVRAVGEKYETTDKDGKAVTKEGKGNLIMYGFGRFPISLYRSQALKLIDEVKSGRFEKAMEENKAKLKDRD
jgi:hypothetical protein